MNYLLFLSLFILCACNSNKNYDNEKFDKKIEVFKVRNDSVNMKFLSRAVYDTAIFYNNLPTSNYEYLLNEIHPLFFRSGLKKYFRSDKFDQPIPIKEVTWEYNETFFLTVWYTPINDTFKPFDIYKYPKDAQF